ncbi:MAG: hypothetical protein AB7O52_17225 [Planctomycetota bacterium]
MLAAVALFGVLLLASAGDVDPASLEWKKPEAAADFKAATEAFDAGKFKEAHEAFKGLKKHAKNDETKRVVESYQRGAEGGYRLAGLQAMAKSGDRHKAFQEAEKSVANYRDTPIGAAFDKFVAELSAELFTWIENFESKGSRYSESKGKTFIDDPKFVREGSRSLRWETGGDNTVLKVRGDQIPQDLSTYRALSVWILFEGRGLPFEFVFVSKGTAQQPVSGDTVKNGFFKSMKAHSGWQRLEVPLAEFVSQGAATWNNIEDFRIQFSKGQKVTLYVDGISLIKK